MLHLNPAGDGYRMAPSFQIAGDIGLYAERLAVSLGFVTFLAGVATFTSCRSFVSLLNRTGHRGLVENKAFRGFYKYHSYYWWAFSTVLVVHMLASVMHTGIIPVPGDPDAQAHLRTLWSALAVFVLFGVQFVSCRTFTGLVDLVSQKPPLTWRIYRGFYRYHSYYWWAFLAAVIGHITFSSLHTHFWPGW